SITGKSKALRNLEAIASASETNEVPRMNSHLRTSSAMTFRECCHDHQLGNPKKHSNLRPGAYAIWIFASAKRFLELSRKDLEEYAYLIVPVCNSLLWWFVCNQSGWLNLQPTFFAGDGLGIEVIN